MKPTQQRLKLKPKRRRPTLLYCLELERRYMAIEAQLFLERLQFEAALRKLSELGVEFAA